MRILIAIPALIVGVYCALGIWFPGIRGRWGGGFTGTAKVKIVLGAVSCAGIALVAISMGLLSLIGNVVPKPYSAGLAICVPCGFILAIIGRMLDTQAHARSAGVYRLPHEIQHGTPDEKRDWLYAAIVLFFLISVLVFMILHA
jgi:hypothetical protein